MVALLIIFASVAAPVVLEVIDTPGVVGLGVLLLVVDGAQIAAAGEVAGRGVDTELQSVSMEPVAEALHVGELVVGADGAVGVTLGGLPGIVDVDVLIAVVGEALILYI